MQPATIIVRADWDSEADVWVATSTDIDGLALESETLDGLMDKVPGALADLIELNGSPTASHAADIPFYIMAEKLGRVRNPAA
jgi:hypothetical protein